MSNILINAVDSEECRIAKVMDGHLEEFHIENTGRQITHGNIFKGIITRVEPSLQAAFIDYGGPKHGFLQKHEIHSDYYLEDSGDNRSIKFMVKRGQELLVQITKDPENSKGAMLTTLISLPGRYMVLMPGSETKGISRKIEDEKERRRLKKIINDLKVPDGYGLIIRTAGKGCAKTVMNIRQLGNTRFRPDVDAIPQQDGKRFVGNVAFAIHDGITQTILVFLTNVMNIREGRNLLNLFQQIQQCQHHIHFEQLTNVFHHHHQQ